MHPLIQLLAPLLLPTQPEGNLVALDPARKRGGCQLWKNPMDGSYSLFICDTETGYNRAVHGLSFEDIFEMAGRYARKWEEEGRHRITKAEEVS